MKRGLIAKKPTPWPVRIAATGALFLVAAAGFAYEWDSKQASGSHNDALAVAIHGDARQRVQAILHSSDTAVEIIAVLKAAVVGGSERERIEAGLALKRIRKHLDD
tara:strand:- start:17 stop:334 length:318 start_codon:yes stop_codon:yes gene_type:complete